MNLSVVIKVSKLCNLRCTYCYETPWLDDASLMSIDNVRKIFQKVLFILEHAPHSARRVQFYWQGGEPFIYPIKYWSKIIAIQREVFSGSGTTIRNEIQSNGTLIKSKHLPLFKKDFFLGISFDVVNELRIDLKGEETDRKVLEVLDWLIEERVQISGCIAVVSQRNINYPIEIANFFFKRRLSFRLLNIYVALDMLPQVRMQAISWDSYLSFCEKILKYVLKKREFLSNEIVIEPLTSALAMLTRHKSILENNSFNEGEREWVWVVNTNGDLYSAGDMYDKRFCYGNIFYDSVNSLIESEGRRRRIARSRVRFESICQHCFLFNKGCDGVYVANCTPEEARAFEELGNCYYGWLADAARKLNFYAI